MSRRFRWTRERYLKAHHLNRLLGRRIECCSAPPEGTSP